MAKSSSIYMGEGKMALAEKWGSALAACSVMLLIFCVPRYLQLIANFGGNAILSSVFAVFCLVWAFCVSSPLMYSCIIGLRQMHIANKSPMDMMVEKFKLNFKRYMVMGFKVTFKLLVAVGIPLVIYLICLLKMFMDVDDFSSYSQFEGIASLSIFAVVVVYFYKVFEYILVPFIIDDNPEMEDKDIIKKSSELSKGYKWTMFKIMVRAILPTVLIMIAVFSVIFFVLLTGVIFGGLAAIKEGRVDDIMSLADSPNKIGIVTLMLYMLITVVVFAYAQVRVTLSLSVLYSEAIGYNGETKNETITIPTLSDEDIIIESEESTKREEEKKDEPEIPYEQRYMPRDYVESKHEAPACEEKKDDSDIPYEQRYMPR